MSNIYKQSLNRKQQQFFPPSIDEYVSEDNPVRAIEDYVELLDMVTLGFTKASLVSTDGQPAYHPKLLLKIYIYGYLNKIRSSRKLESEIKRNIEMMWLCAGLSPSYKTIADFRKENSKALKKVFREFSLLLKELNLITGEIVAVDGAFLRANASKNQLLMKKTLEKDIQAIDEKIENYLTKMAFADKEDKTEHTLKALPKDVLAKITHHKSTLEKSLTFLEEKGLTQYNQTDPDARLMRKPAHNLMAYNAQIVVDSSYKFIVATEASSRNNDFGKLYTMAKQTQEITQKKHMIILADSGYYSAKEIVRCTQEGITTYVPSANKETKANKKGYFMQSDFIYDTDKDYFVCPNHQILTKSNICNTKKDGTKYTMYRAGSKTCNACPLRSQCIPDKTAYKKVAASEYFQSIQIHKEKMKTVKAKNMMQQRASLVEHPFGTIKQTLGWSHYLVRGLEKVGGENALIMFTYNFKRLLNLLGTALFRKLIQALKSGSIEAVKVEIEEHIAHFKAYLAHFLEYIRFYVLKPKSLQLLA